MTIPIIAFFYLYLLFVLVWLIFSVIALYHMVKYGQINAASILATIGYLAFSVVILYLSYQFFVRIDWNVGLTISQGGVNFFGSTDY